MDPFLFHVFNHLVHRQTLLSINSPVFNISTPSLSFGASHTQIAYKIELLDRFSCGIRVIALVSLCSLDWVWKCLWICCSINCRVVSWWSLIFHSLSRHLQSGVGRGLAGEISPVLPQSQAAFFLCSFFPKLSQCFLPARTSSCCPLEWWTADSLAHLRHLASTGSILALQPLSPTPGVEGGCWGLDQ